MVLERDQGQGKTRVAVEPELEGDVENVGATLARERTRGRATKRPADEGVELVGRVEVRREGLPEVEPLAVVAVDDLTANLHLNLLEHSIPKAALDTAGPDNVGVRSDHVRENNLHIGLSDQVCVAVDHSNNALPPGGRTREIHTHRLHGEVRVALVEHLPEGDVGISNDVGILRAIGNELKKTTAHLCLYF